MWHIGGNEIHASFLKSKKEMRVARQAVQLGDHKLGFVDTAHLQCLLKLRTVGVLSAFNFRELSLNRTWASTKQARDGLALSLKPSPDFPCRSVDTR